MTFEDLLSSLPRPLTPCEQRLFRVVWTARGQWARQENLLLAGWPDWYDGGVADDGLRHALRVNISRLRHKLAGTSWSIENDGSGSYRLRASARAGQAA